MSNDVNETTAKRIAAIGLFVVVWIACCVALGIIEAVDAKRAKGQ